MSSQRGAGRNRSFEAARRGSQAPRAGQGASTPKRLGAQAQPARGARPATGAARRYERGRGRGRGSRPAWLGWGAVGVVLVVLVVLLVVKLSGGSSSSSSSSDAAGRHPAPAPASLVSALTTIPASTFNAVGTAAEASPFTVTKGQPPLTLDGKPQFVYDGGEFCPYCAMMRWSMIAALGRFGTFHGLKITSSASTDGDIPTFSFLGSSYTSPYVSFTPYESEDRLQQPLQIPPAYVQKLEAKYDGTGTTPAKPFNTGPSSGIPFLDIGNKYVESGDPGPMAVIFEAYGYLNNGGPGRPEIAAALRSPSSSLGKSIDARVFIVQANYIAAAICSLDGGKPGSVCASPGVVAAAKVLAKTRPVG